MMVQTNLAWRVDTRLSEYISEMLLGNSVEVNYSLRLFHVPYIDHIILVHVE